MTDNEIIKALEWCEQFENNIVMSDISGEKFILALQAMQIIKQALKEYTRQKAEIERLKAESQMADGYADALVERTKSEAIKEFAERLKEKSWIGMWDIFGHVDVDDIDNLVAEMTEQKG